MDIYRYCGDFKSLIGKKRVKKCKITRKKQEKKHYGEVK